ncbi:MAG: hypothetical protein GY730_07660 [bacterium]|nr:hypothetical protein [bacterium]
MSKTTKCKVQSMNEFTDEGNRLFGENKRHWEFVCPVCKTVQSANDFLKRGLDPNKYIGYSCIGRFKKNPPKAFGNKKIAEGSGCDFTNGGLFRLGPKIIILENKTERYTFDFNRSEEPNDNN